MNDNQLATINEPDGSTLNIYERKDDTGWVTGYDAERVAPDGSKTFPQYNMTAEECIRYLAHLGNGYAASAMLRKRP